MAEANAPATSSLGLTPLLQLVLRRGEGRESHASFGGLRIHSPDIFPKFSESHSEDDVSGIVVASLGQPV